MDEDRIRKWLHDLNNRVGTVLAQAELLQLENLSAKARARTKLIEDKTIEVRQMIRDIGDHLFE